MTTTQPRPSLIRESMTFAGQLLTRWRRLPVIPMQAILLPVLLLVTYHLLVSKSMTKLTGTDTLDVLVPTCALAGAMFGAVGVGLVIPYERKIGLLGRYWTLPVHRASALVGRLIAEAARAFIGSVVVTIVGLGLGLRFPGGWWRIIPFMAIPALVVVIFAMVVIAVATRTDSTAPFAVLGPLVVAMVFGSGGVAPLQTMPSWLRPIAQYQPMASVIEVMRSLEYGAPSAAALLLAAAWWVTLAAIFGPLAYTGYRGAAQR